MTRDFFNARLAEKKPGDLINLTIFRFDEMSTLLIRLGESREGTYRIVPSRVRRKHSSACINRG